MPQTTRCHSVIRYALGALFLAFAPPAVADICSPSAGSDCVGNDLVNYTNVPDLASCCARCEAFGPRCTVWKWDSSNPTCYLKDGCGNPYPHCPTCFVGTRPVPPRPSVFSCETPTSTLTVFNDSSYEVRMGPADADVAWFTGGDVAIVIDHSLYSFSGGTLIVTSSGPNTPGADAYGSFTSWPVNLVAMMGPGASTQVNVEFVCYASGLIGFNLTLPTGASNTSGASPATQFPSFVSAGVLGESIGWLLNGGIWTLFELWGVGTSNGYNGSDGPVWLYNTSFGPSTTAPAGSPAVPTVALISALAHFKSAVTAVADGRLVFGVPGAVQSIPPGFESSFGLYASAAGVNGATREWGALVTAAYGTVRISPQRDVLNSKLSYWSDNGAVYFQSWWDRQCERHCNASTGNAEDQFVALKQYHQSAGLPFAIYQLDTWWFLQGADVGDGSSLDCADWAPRADLFPNGLPAVTAHDIPLLLYAWGFIQVAQGNRMTNFTWVDAGGQEAMVALDEVYAFYSMLRDRFLAYNGTSFEQDNMGSYSSAWRQVTDVVDGGSRWWAGFASPWCESGIPVQVCEATASDLLESVRYGCVTSTRDNIDDVPGAHQAPDGNEPNFLVRWHVGFDRMLMGALQLKPFFDNVWSAPVMPGSTWGGAAENYTELAMALSVLGGGAVGIGDAVGASNVSLIMATATADGTLLSPSLPSTYIEAVYLPPGSQPWPVAVGRVLQAAAFVPAGGSGDSSNTWMTVLSVDVGPSFALRPRDLYPDLSQPAPGTQPGQYTAVAWSPGFAGIAAMCADGAPAAQCAAAFDALSPLELQTGVPRANFTHAFELFSLAPLFSSGYALLGELDKFVRVSPARFAWANSSGGGGDGSPALQFSVRGGAGEALSVAVLAPGDVATIKRVPLQFGPAGGTLVVTCMGSSPAAACSSA